MVKFVGNIPSEFVCTILGAIKSTGEQVKSTTVQVFEIQARKIYVISKA